MSESAKTPFDAVLDQIRLIVREEIAAAHTTGNNMTTGADALLIASEAAALMNVKPRWLYRHAAKLPFTRRINRKTLRFSEAGIRRWLATKKPSSSR
jgi:predicted DNA-binding transcriptional regulator AlpA